MNIPIVRFVVACSVLSTFVFVALAQNQPEVEVIKFGWRKLSKSSVPSGERSLEMRNAHIDATIAEERRKREPNYAELERLKDQKQNQVTPLDAPTPSKKGYEYKIKFRNAGSKEIAVLIWVYIFKDAVTGRELIRHRFESKVKIKAGKVKEVKSYTDSSPPMIVTARAKEKNQKEWKEEIVIEQVKYADVN